MTTLKLSTRSKNNLIDVHQDLVDVVHRALQITKWAVDLCALIGGRASWSWPPYEEIASAMKQAAQELGVEIQWGGDWTSFKDGPHFELKNIRG